MRSRGTPPLGRSLRVGCGGHVGGQSLQEGVQESGWLRETCPAQNAWRVGTTAVQQPCLPGLRQHSRAHPHTAPHTGPTRTHPLLGPGSPFSLKPQCTSQLRLGSTPRPFLRSHSSPRSTRSRPPHILHGNHLHGRRSSGSHACMCCARPAAQQGKSRKPCSHKSSHQEAQELASWCKATKAGKRGGAPETALPHSRATARALNTVRCSSWCTSAGGMPNLCSSGRRAPSSHSRRSRCSAISDEISSRPCSPKFCGRQTQCRVVVGGRVVGGQRGWQGAVQGVNAQLAEWQGC